MPEHTPTHVTKAPPAEITGPHALAELHARAISRGGVTPALRTAPGYPRIHPVSWRSKLGLDERGPADDLGLDRPLFGPPPARPKPPAVDATALVPDPEVDPPLPPRRKRPSEEATVRAAMIVDEPPPVADPPPLFDDMAPTPVEMTPLRPPSCEDLALAAANDFERHDPTLRDRPLPIDVPPPAPDDDTAAPDFALATPPPIPADAPPAAIIASASPAARATDPTLPATPRSRSTVPSLPPPSRGRPQPISGQRTLLGPPPATPGVFAHLLHESAAPARPARRPGQPTLVRTRGDAELDASTDLIPPLPGFVARNHNVLLGIALGLLLGGGVAVGLWIPLHLSADDEVTVVRYTAAPQPLPAAAQPLATRPHATRPRATGRPVTRPRATQPAEPRDPPRAHRAVLAVLPADLRTREDARALRAKAAAGDWDGATQALSALPRDLRAQPVVQSWWAEILHRQGRLEPARAVYKALLDARLHGRLRTIVLVGASEVYLARRYRTAALMLVRRAERSWAPAQGAALKQRITRQLARCAEAIAAR